MCIIAVKPAGLEPISYETLEICFENNPDGGGYAIAKPNENIIHIHKGFMTFNDYKTALEGENIQLDDIVIYHTRIATSGGTNKEKCHPFPITDNEDDLNTTDIICTKALIHNGVFGPGSKELSDTQLFIKNTLMKYSNIKDNILSILGEIGTNKVVLMEGDDVFILGTWIKDDGYYFSNSNYKAKKYKYTPSTYNYDHSYYDNLNDYSYGNYKRNVIVCPKCKKEAYAESSISGFRDTGYCAHCQTKLTTCIICNKWAEDKSEYAMLPNNTWGRTPVLCSKKCISKYNYKEMLTKGVKSA